MSIVEQRAQNCQVNVDASGNVEPDYNSCHLLPDPAKTAGKILTVLQSAVVYLLILLNGADFRLR